MFGIHNLPAKLTIQNQSGLYVTATKDRNTGMEYLTSCLNSEKVSTLLCFESIPTFFKNCSQSEKDQLKARLNRHETYFSSINNTSLPLDKITQDLQKHPLNTHNSVLIYLSKATISSAKNNIKARFFNYLNKIAQQKDLIIHIITYGQQNHTLSHWLIEHPQWFLGVSYLHLDGNQQYRYFIHYWIAQGEISTNLDYKIHKTADKTFAVQVNNLEQSTLQSERFHDQERLYVSELAIDGTPNKNKSFVRFANNKALFDGIEVLQAATLVLNITQQEEAQELAKHVYRLRRRFGFNFKVVLRETHQCLRYADQLFLTQSGINLIVPPSVQYPRFLSMVEALQQQSLTCSVPDSLDELLALENHALHDHKGYVNNHFFADRCYQAIQQHEKSQLQFALIKLNVIPGMDVQYCLNMAEFKRDGDLITACDHGVYVLLSSIRSNDVPIALSHIFKLPIVDLFLQQTLYTNVEDVKDQIPIIITRAVPVFEQSSNGTILEPQAHPHATASSSSTRGYATHKPIGSQS